jgi:hypothetical protein
VITTWITKKDFDDYDDYQRFVGENPEYDTANIFQRLWTPWNTWDRLFAPMGSEIPTLPADTRHLPEWVNLEKYEKRRFEKRQTEAEKAEKRHSLERTRAYLTDYLEENSDDTEAKSDLEKVEKEFSSIQ